MCKLCLYLRHLELQLYIITFSLEPAGLVVSLKSKWLLPMKRQELFGIPDMMAKFGGLFGLVMGASVISFLELVYYCIIRPWRNDYPARSAGWQVFPWTA